GAAGAGGAGMAVGSGASSRSELGSGGFGRSAARAASAATSGASASGVAPGGVTKKACLQREQRTRAPRAGMRDSSSLKRVSQRSQRTITRASPPADRSRACASLAKPAQRRAFSRRPRSVSAAQPSRLSPPARASARASARHPPCYGAPPLADAVLDRRLVIVTGKGGTGKTTVAATLALAAAAQGRRVLVA